MEGEKMKTATVNHTIKIAKVGTYKSTIEIIDNATGEQVALIEREHPKRSRAAVARATLNEAYELARENGFNHISMLNTTENELTLSKGEWF
jgi:hypothetical protein